MCPETPTCMSKFYCDSKKPEFHENESSVSSWKPGELIKLFDYSFFSYLLCGQGCVHSLKTWEVRLINSRRGSSVNSEAKK